jgi:hypothetical protein
MSHNELEQIIGKARRLKELRRAKERVRQLERELRGEPPRPEEPTWVPEFLRTQVSSGLANLTGADVTYLRDEARSRALTTMNGSETREPSINGSTRSLLAGGPRAT